MLKAFWRIVPCAPLIAVVFFASTARECHAAWPWSSSEKASSEKTTGIKLAMPDFGKSGNSTATSNSTTASNRSGVQSYAAVDTEKPGAWQRMTGAVSDATGRVTASVKSTFNKSRDAVAGAQPTKGNKDPVALSGKLPKPDAEFYLAAARLHEASGNDREAEQQYRKALQVSPRHLEAQLGYARLLDRSDRLDEALKLYAKATSDHPAEAATFNDLGLCHARHGQSQQAIAALRHAIELQPGKKLYRNNLATVLAEFGHYPEALEQLSAAHGPAVGHYNLGYLLSQKGDQRAAALHFSKALEMDPSFADARQWLDTLAQRGEIAPGGIPQTAQRSPSPAHSMPRVADGTSRYAPVAPAYGNPLEVSPQPSMTVPGRGFTPEAAPAHPGPGGLPTQPSSQPTHTPVYYPPSRY